MALTQLKTGAIADDAVTTDKLANAPVFNCVNAIIVLVNI